MNQKFLLTPKKKKNRQLYRRIWSSASITDTKQRGPKPTSKELKELFNKDHVAKTCLAKFASLPTNVN